MGSSGWIAAGCKHLKANLHLLHFPDTMYSHITLLQTVTQLSIRWAHALKNANTYMHTCCWLIWCQSITRTSHSLPAARNAQKATNITIQSCAFALCVMALLFQCTFVALTVKRVSSAVMAILTLAIAYGVKQSLTWCMVSVFVLFYLQTTYTNIPFWVHVLWLNSFV